MGSYWSIHNCLSAKVYFLAFFAIFMQFLKTGFIFADNHIGFSGYQPLYSYSDYTEDMVGITWSNCIPTPPGSTRTTLPLVRTG